MSYESTRVAQIDIQYVYPGRYKSELQWPMSGRQMNGKTAKTAQGLCIASTAFSAGLNTVCIRSRYELSLNHIWRKSIHPVWSTGLVVLLPAIAAVNGRYLKAQCMDFGVQWLKLL